LSSEAPPGRETAWRLDNLTPRQIVAELDKYVVGQRAAKRSVAIALRNRWRRQQLPPEVAAEIYPKNILMIGPTGVGKTEIARRLAKLAQAPFIKVEASKFTEVGYVGRDCESMVRDLMEAAVGMVREEMRQRVAEPAREAAEEKILQILVPSPPPAGSLGSATAGEVREPRETRERYREKLRSGQLDERSIEIEIDEDGAPNLEFITPQGSEDIGMNLKEMLPGLFTRRRRKQVPVAEARRILFEIEAERMLDRQRVAQEARERLEQAGIIFLDEIDKIAGRESGRGPDVSREGVQRDLLPIVEGTTVSTKYGAVRTDHVLFIAAGAFHVSKPSDLIPEMQGRFPIRVELEALTEDDFVRILTEPQSALTKQYAALLGTEGLQLTFTGEAIREIARMAVEVNSRNENIGARRLATLLERLLDELSFEAPDMQGVAMEIGATHVQSALANIVRDDDLSRYVL
jgi:ATP-dependent HslUV protease ATP-binding subunit HslU